MVKWTHWESFQLNVDIFRFQIPQATQNLSSLRKCVHQQLRHSYCSAVKNMALAKLLKLQELLNYNCYQLKKSNNCQPITLTVRVVLNIWLKDCCVLHILKDKKIIEKLKKGNNQTIYTNKLLKTCKSWGGLVTSIDELDDNLRAHGGLWEKNVLTEL